MHLHWHDSPSLSQQDPYSSFEPDDIHPWIHLILTFFRMDDFKHNLQQRWKWNRKTKVK